MTQAIDVVNERLQCAEGCATEYWTSDTVRVWMLTLLVKCWMLNYDSEDSMATAACSVQLSLS